MEEASSPTDISSSLSEFVRKERLLKELYQDEGKNIKSFEIEHLKYNDEEIDSILQQMGKLLSPEEADNSVYKHVIEETENKSIEQILNEAKELVRESTPLYESTSPCLSIDDLSSEFTENEITFINNKNSGEDETDVNGNTDFGNSTDEDEIRTRMKLRNRLNNNDKFFTARGLPETKKKPSNIFQNLISSSKEKLETDASTNEILHLRKELDRLNQLYTSSKEEYKDLKIKLTNLQGQKWASNTTTVDLHIKKEKLGEVIEALNNASMDYRILVQDVQQAIDEENPPIMMDELNEFSTRKGHRLTFEHYHRMADVHGFLDYLASARSNLVSVETIGNSVEGRPIKMIKIGSGKPNASAFWIDGGIHAREWIAVASVSYIINELVENRESLEKELQDVDFYIVPLLNPDGYEYSHESERLWRKNRRRNFGAFCVGTDLNRNWDYEWGGQGSGKFPCQEIYAGTGPLSEPETKAVSSYILSNPSKFKAFVTFHSYGQYILYPWGYAKKLPPDAEDLDRVGRIAAAAMKQNGGSTYSVGNSAALLYAAAGGSDDWAKGTAKIKYSYTIELRDTGRHGFLLPASYIKSSGREAFAAIKVIAKEMNS